MEQQLPAAVTTAAVEHGFGGLLAVWEGAGKGCRVIAGCGGAVAVAVAALAVSHWATQVHPFSSAHGLLRAISTSLFPLVVFLGLRGLLSLLVPTRSAYLYEGGLVATTGRRTAVHGWDDVERIEAVNRRRLGEDSLVGYRVHPRSGEPVTLPSTAVPGGAADRMLAELRTRGLSVD